MPYTDSDDMETSGQTSRPSGTHLWAWAFFKLTAAGGMAFWVTTIALSLLPIAADYRAALSLKYFQTVFVESLVAGMLIGACVSFVLLRFYETVPTKNTILKSEVLSLVILAILSIVVQVASSRGAGSDALRVFLIGMALNVPRFLLLGLAIGYLFRRSSNRDNRVADTSATTG